ncbi:MAG: M48 family metalloprotease [Candidatus Korobacteraceae bacterium]
MKHRIILAVILFIAVAALIVGERRRVEAEVSPAPILYFVADTEQELTRVPVSLTRISDKEEIAVGDEMARNYLEASKKNDTPEDRTISDYVSRVRAKVTGHAHRKLPYKFHYLPDDYLVNAFALPGGRVFIGKGLLTLMDTEDELANVLGHEVEHVELGHCAERAQIEARVNKLPMVINVVGLPIEVFQAGYSKEQELETDREGTKLAVAGGYSAEGAIPMFQRFQKLEAEWRRYEARRRQQPSVVELPAGIVNQVVLQTLQGYFRSHPPEQERIAQIERLLVTEHWSMDQKQQPLQVAYLLLTDEAAALLGRDEVDKALAKVKDALAMKSDYVPALNVLGDINFEKADFAAAAQAYRQSLTFEPKQKVIAARYATSLAASLPAPEAAAHYAEWLDSAAPAAPDLDWFMVEEVGLKLLAGDAAAAKTFAESLAKSENADAPLVQARLGWWYYRANNAQTAADLIGLAVEQRPQIGSLSAKLGWALAAQKKYESAQQRFYAANNDTGSDARAEAQMGVAVTAWEAKEPDLALTNYRAAILEHRAWGNPQCVAALYGQPVAASVQAIRQENDKRQKAKGAVPRQ